MQIRRLEDRDPHLDTVSRWIWEQWRDTSGLTLAQSQDQLVARPDCPATLLAVDGDEVLGVLGFRRVNYQGREPLRLFINSLFVKESARARGIGTALLAAAVSRQVTDPEAIYVYTSIHGWYAARGFQVVEEDGTTGNTVLRRDSYPKEVFIQGELAPYFDGPND